MGSTSKKKGGSALKKRQSGMWKAISGDWEVLKDKTGFKISSDIKFMFWTNKCGETLLRESFLGFHSIVASKDIWVVNVWDNGSWGPRFARQLHD